MLVLADTSTPFSKLIVQVYSPESADCRKGRLCDEVYSAKDFISVAAATVPSGRFHVVLTNNETFIIELSSAMQVKAREDPDKTGLGELE